MPRIDRTPIPDALMHEVANEIVATEQAQFEQKARTAGWVPLADVLDALRNEDAVLRFAERHGDDLDGWWIENRDRERMRLYLAERFAPTTAPEGADERNGHG